MSSIAPAPHVTTVAAATPVALAGSTHVSGATNLPPGLANLTAGAILTGSVVGRDPQGHFLVQTANGTLLLASALNLPQGSTLSLQVQTVGAQIQMVVLSINQQPPSAGHAALVTVVPPAPGSAPPQTPAAGAVTQQGAGLQQGSLLQQGTATQQGAAGASVAAAEGPAVTVAPASLLTATVVADAFDPANQSGGGAALTADPQFRTAFAPQAANVAQDNPPMLAALLGRAVQEADSAPETPAKGTRIAARIAAFDPEPASDPTALLRTASETRPGAKLMPGIVAEPDVAGNVMVQTPAGLLSLSTKISLPPQSRIVLELLGEPEPPPSAPPAATDQGSAPLSQSRGWPALEQVLSVLSRGGETAPQHTAEAAIARPGPEFAQAFQAAVAAIKTGDVRALVGNHALKSLDLAGHRDLSVRLGEEFQQLSARVPDPAGGDWRTMLVPVHDGSALQFVRMYLKRNRKQGANESDSDSMTRFVVEVDLTRMGAMQLDGLIKPKKFDLIIRSHVALDAGMRRDITKIFSDSLGASGHSGSVTFQATNKFAPVPGRGTMATGVGLSV